MSASREVLAQQAAARLIANACGSHTALWNRQERAHAAASSRPEARAAAAPLLEICGDCPIVAECGQWAVLDQYTGIAAGSAWVKGVGRPAHWVHQHPMKKLAG